MIYIYYTFIHYTVYKIIFLSRTYSLVVSNTLASVHIFKPFVSSLLFIKCNVTVVYLLTITYYTRTIYTYLLYLLYI